MGQWLLSGEDLDLRRARSLAVERDSLRRLYLLGTGLSCFQRFPPIVREGAGGGGGGGGGGEGVEVAEERARARARAVAARLAAVQAAAEEEAVDMLRGVDEENEEGEAEEGSRLITVKAKEYRGEEEEALVGWGGGDGSSRPKRP